MIRTEYEALEGVNFSTLKHILKSPAHYQAALATKTEPTPAMIIGTIAHSVILEGVLLSSIATQKPDGMSFATKEGKAWREGNSDREILSFDGYNAILGMAAAIDLHPEARAMLDECKEREKVAGAEIHGVLCKGILDARGPTILADLKTAEDASPHAWASAVQARDYDMQMAMYQALAGEVWAGWIVVEKEPPYAVTVYTPTVALQQSGQEKLRRALELLKACRESGKWPAYPGVQLCDAPRWRTAEMEANSTPTQ